MSELTKDDKSFLGYVELHCKTERALFSWKDVRRLYALADVDMQEDIGMSGFYRMEEGHALPLVELARLREPKAEIPVLKMVQGWALLQGTLNTQKLVEWRMYAVFPEKAIAEVQSTKLAGRTKVLPCDLAALKVLGLCRLPQGTYVDDPEYDSDLSDND